MAASRETPLFPLVNLAKLLCTSSFRLHPIPIWKRPAFCIAKCAIWIN